MANEVERPIIGQEAICPDGLGRVIAFSNNFPDQWIQISTYVNDRQCKWNPRNIELIPLNRRVISEDKAIELALCEVAHLVLRKDTLYIFKEMPGCEKCKELADTYR